MTSWSRGYVADAPYTVSYHPTQVPSHMALAAAINGVDWQPRERMTVADIGCGRGYVIAALAASNPGWNCIGLDYNPGQIAEAMDFAEEAGLDNLGFVEADLAAMSDSDMDSLPMLDVAMLHGVWTWVADPVRAGIVRLLSRRLKPGGVVYISYNSLPGFGQDAALQRLLRLGASLAPRGDSVERVLHALPLVKELQATNPKMLANTYMLKRLVQEGPPPNPPYLAHEFMTEHWRPVFQADLAEALAPARLDYIGSSTLVENIPDMFLEPAQRAIWDRMPEGSPQELVKDLCIERPFRRDIYMRGMRKIDRRAALDKIIVALATHETEKLPGLPTSRGMANLAPEVANDVLAALRQGPQRIGDLRRLTPGRSTTPEELLVMLNGAGTVEPIWRTRVDANAVARARRFNERAAAHYAGQGTSEGQYGLASPFMGAALPVTSLELYLATRPELQGVTDPTEAEARLRPLLPPEADEKAIATAMKTLTDRLPVWQRFGVV
ncbi:class I SAM-dependent methyltransferase [Muricoccus radiodurans]|uniref:class I SAM-dependent methyltransferase n=1 Tax=Muricoccus radiodurans TaxID=2231721 RepID=UPI003CF1B923